MLHHGIYTPGHYGHLRLDPRAMEQPKLLAPTRAGLEALLRGPGDAGRRAIEQVFTADQVRPLPSEGQARRWLVRSAAQEFREVSVEGLQVTLTDHTARLRVTAPFPEGYPTTEQSLAMLVGYLHTATGTQSLG
jgi:hypothetical protein